MPTVTAPTLTAEQQAKLAALANYGTRYEVILVHPDGRSLRLCYTGRKSVVGLDHGVSPHARSVVAWLGIDPATAQIRRAKGELHLTGGGIVRFSGRTQREAIMEGEIPWIGSTITNRP